MLLVFVDANLVLIGNNLTAVHRPIIMIMIVVIIRVVLRMMIIIMMKIVRRRLFAIIVMIDCVIAVHDWLFSL